MQVLKVAALVVAAVYLGPVIGVALQGGVSLGTAASVVWGGVGAVMGGVFAASLAIAASTVVGAIAGHSDVRPSGGGRKSLMRGAA